MTEPTVSVVIPVFNSEGSLRELCGRLARVLPEVSSRHEVIFVDDSSRDRSWEVVRELAEEHAWVRGISLMRNYGQHNAVLCGIREAQYDVIVTMDDDLQHPPEEIAKLLARLGEGFDVVYGTPEREQHGLWRVLASQVTKLVLQNAMGAASARQVSAFRAFRTALREAFVSYQGPGPSIDVLLTWGTVRFDAVKVRHEPRSIGASNYTVGKLLRHAANMVTGFSILPLQLASVVGFAFSVLGVLVLCYVLARYFIQGTSVPGFPFLASVIAIFSGAQLFALGIMGEYLARVHFRMMDRPTYAVRSTVGPARTGPSGERS